MTAAREHRQPGTAPVLSGTTRATGLRVLALLLGLGTALYGVVWVYYALTGGPNAYLGIDYSYQGLDRKIRVNEVKADSPAARAGVKAGDVIVAIDGAPLDTAIPIYEHVVRGQPGTTVTLTVERPDQPRSVEVAVQIERRQDRPIGLVDRIALTPLSLYPLPFLLVGFTVLALRVEDRHAWLLALAFVGLSTGPTYVFESIVHPRLRGFMLGSAALADGMGPAFVYALLASFPAPSPLDRRVPWLKYFFIAFAAVVFVPFALWILISGSPWPAARAVERLIGLRSLELTLSGYAYLAIGLGFVSVLLNSRRGDTAEARRKARFLLWSFAVGLLPWLTLVAAATIAGRNPFQWPVFVWAPAAILLMMLPLMVAYTIVRHRVFEFPAFLRRSARYLLVQRGFLLLSVAVSVSVVAMFALALGKLLPRIGEAALPAGIAVGAAFGLVLVGTGSAVARRVSKRIDRAFFRSVYDASKLLEDLAQRTALVTDRDELAQLLEEHLTEALHPRDVAVYLRARFGGFGLHSRSAHPRPPRLTEDDELVARLERLGRPFEVEEGRDLPASPLASLDPECLVPMLNRRRTIVGVMALGPRLSDDPYSREDVSLLASIASQAGGALENLMLAEEMADRLEAERRATQELQIAAGVQRRLLPVRPPAMTTIEVAGHCTQARDVGGDYYDFVDLGPHRLGLVLADVSGKGLYAALLMASLQASLRSLLLVGADDLPGLLRQVNQSFGESTGRTHFATVFLGVYDDRTRVLTYCDCGHAPPVVCRAGHPIERLSVTGGAIGLFEEWSCESRKVKLAPGDLLALFSDGMTEAIDDRDEEFGEARLFDGLKARSDDPLPVAVDAVMAEVRRFSGPHQTDDMTLVLLRALAPVAPAALTGDVGAFRAT